MVWDLFYFSRRSGQCRQLLQKLNLSGYLGPLICCNATQQAQLPSQGCSAVAKTVWKGL